MMETVSLEGEIRRETELAILFFDGSVETWIPKSQIQSTVKYSDSVEIEIPRWLAEEREMI